MQLFDEETLYPLLLFVSRYFQQGTHFQQIPIRDSFYARYKYKTIQRDVSGDNC